MNFYNLFFRQAKTWVWQYNVENGHFIADLVTDTCNKLVVLLD